LWKVCRELVAAELQIAPVAAGSIVGKKRGDFE
jgi:hypothetical protein